MLRIITIFLTILLVSSFALIAYTDQTALNVNQSGLENQKIKDDENNGGNNHPDRLNLSENVAVTVHHKYVNPHDKTITEKIVVYTSLNQNSMSLLKQNSDTKTTMDRIWNLDRIRFNGRSIVSENTLWDQEAPVGKLASFIKTEPSSDEQIKINDSKVIDSNRNFVQDVYPQVQARDGNWTGDIPVGNYIRATFGKNLTSNNDITIFARSNYSGSSVQVYEKDSNQILAQFGNITQDNSYRIFLINLNGSQDTFDLKIVGNPVDFDYIVDPSFTPSTSDTVGISNKASTGKSVKDVVAISESAKMPQKKVSDTLSLSEKEATSRPVKDVVAISESAKMPQKKVSDTLSLSEKEATSSPVKDVVAISESASVTTSAFHPVSVTDTLSLSEKASTSLPVKDVVAISESAIGRRVTFASLSESIILSDTVSKAISSSLIESLTLADQSGNFKFLVLLEKIIIDDVMGLNLAPNQDLVSNTQTTLTVDPVQTDLVILDSNASLATVTVPSTVTSAELNYSKIVQTNSTNTVQINNPLTITKDINGDSNPDVQVAIPADITVEGPTTWKGTISLPAVVSNPPLPQEPNTIITPSKSIELGSSSTTLTFDKAVRLSFTGDAGKRAGYFNSVTPFTEITTTCSDDTQATNDGLPTGGNCKINVGSDLVVWTKHFTGFASFSSSSSNSGSSSSSSGGRGGGGATGVGPSGGSGGGAAGFGGQLAPYLKINQVSYDTCDTKTVKILVATDSNKDPTVIIRSSAGVVDAKQALVQPYLEQNTNSTIRKLVYEAPLVSQEKSFEVLALEAVGHDVYSEGRTVEITGCQETINFANELTTQVDLSAPKIFDTKFSIGNGTKVVSSEITDQYVDGKPMTVYSIIESPTPLDRAELRYFTPGQGTTNYAAVKMDIVPLPVSNSTYVISGTISPQFMKSPALQYWIHVENQAAKSSDSVQYSVGVKPDYQINGKLELDVIQNRAAGTTVTPTAYYTNNSTGPVFGTVSLVVDGNTVYMSPPQLFGVGQTAVQLKWKTTTLGFLTTYQVKSRADLYGKSLESEIKIVNTFLATQIIPLSQSKIIGSISSQDGHNIAIPIIIHSSFNNEGHMRYHVTSSDGTCVIGANQNCLVTGSTLELPGEFKSITLGDQIYRVRYSGPDSPLERFSIISIDPILGQWKVEIDSRDGLVPQAYAMQHIFLQIKYKPVSTLP